MSWTSTIILTEIICKKKNIMAVTSVNTFCRFCNENGGKNGRVVKWRKFLVFDERWHWLACPSRWSWVFRIWFMRLSMSYIQKKYWTILMKYTFILCCFTKPNGYKPLTKKISTVEFGVIVCFNRREWTLSVCVCLSTHITKASFLAQH